MEYEHKRRITGVTVNALISMIILAGYMLVDRQWSPKGLAIFVAFFLGATPIIVFTLRSIERRASRHLYKYLDCPADVSETELKSARTALLLGPWRSALYTFVIWTIITPPILFQLLNRFGENSCPFKELYLALLALSPIFVTINLLAFELLARPYVAQLFPKGGVENVKSVFTLTVRKRLILTFLVVGPYCWGMLALLVYRRLLISHDLAEATDSVKWLVVFLLLVFFALFGLLVFYARKGIDQPLDRFLSHLRSTNNGVASSLVPVESIDDWGLIAERLNDRTLAAQALKVSEERVRSVIESVPLGVMVVTQQGSIESINAAITRMFGYGSDELCQQNLSVIIQDCPLVSSSQVKLEECDSVKCEAKTKNRSTFPAEVTLKPFETIEGSRWLMVVQDITERERSEQLRQEFVAMVGHDLRTPLAALQGFLEILSTGNYGTLSPTGNDRLLMASRSIGRLMNLVSDILDAARMEAGRLEMNPGQTSTEKIVASAIDSISEIALQKNIQISTQITKAELLADKDRLVQVLVNLLSNALKFSPSGSVVSVAVEPISHQFEFCVIDQGKGIPVEFRKSVFDRFQQVQDEDGFDHRTGTGLGLAICKAIVESHGGTIGVDSELGKGSRFWFRIPSHIARTTTKRDRDFVETLADN
jgi:PAS domain S-box-containing protein